jgi:hypothetical protein
LENGEAKIGQYAHSWWAMRPGIGARHLLDKVEKLSGEKYGITGKGEMG